MKMEIPDDAEDKSCLLIGALSAVRDLVAGQNQISPMLDVQSSDMGCLIEALKQLAISAHEIKFGTIRPTASNND